MLFDKNQVKRQKVTDQEKKKKKKTNPYKKTERILRIDFRLKKKTNKKTKQFSLNPDTTGTINTSGAQKEFFFLGEKHLSQSGEGIICTHVLCPSCCSNV